MDALAGAARCGPRSDAHALDQVDRCRPPEVLVEIGGLVNQLAVAVAADIGNHLHDVVPLRHIDAAMFRHGRRQRYGPGYLLQRAQGNATQPVFFIDDFPLLGDAQAAVDGARRGTQHRRVGLGAAAADGATPAMKQVQFDVVVAENPGQFDLCFLQRPARGCQARVLVTVGVADHDGLPVSPLFEVFSIQVVSEEPAKYLLASLQIVDGLQKRRDIDRHFVMAVVQLAPVGKQQHRQNVIRTLCHADDEWSDRTLAVFAFAKRDCLEYRQRFACGDAL